VENWRVRCSRTLLTILQFIVLEKKTGHPFPLTLGPPFSYSYWPKGFFLVFFLKDEKDGDCTGAGD
jgi:hypothetical protein